MSTTQVKNGFQGGTDDQLLVNPDGSINVNSTGGGGGGNASVGVNGVTGPASSTQIAGVDPSGNLHPVSVDSNGFVNVNGTSVVTGTVTTNQAGLNTFQTSQYTIGLTAVQLAPTPLTNRSSISLTIIAGPDVAVYIGNSSSVTVLNGYPLYDGSSIQLDLTATGQIWAVSNTTGSTACIMEIA